MSVAKEVEKCVVFLARFDGIEQRLTGTAFLICEVIPGTQADISYLVTARHVIERIRDCGKDGKSYVHLNLKNGERASVSLDLSQWVFHEDARVDVAVAAVDLKDMDDHLAVPSKMFATHDVLANTTMIRLGIGVYFPGLFIHHPGESQIIPIMRFGNIAAMPSEPVRTTMGNMEAYLIEARSIGGLSGSPVFVDFGLHTQKTYLLGLVHGHFGVRDVLDSDNSHEDALLALIDREPRSINMGIGVVVPSQRIIDVLQQPEFLDKKAALAIVINASRDAPLPEAD